MWSPLAQPKMGLIRNLLGRTFYPDNTWTRDRDGSPLRPYDSATHTMNEFMGVRVDPIDVAVKGDLQTLTEAVPLVGKVADGSNLVLDGRLNASFKAVNLLIDKGVAVRRVDKASSGAPSRRLHCVVGSPSPYSKCAKANRRRLQVDLEATSEWDARRQTNARRHVPSVPGRQHGRGLDPFLLEQFAFPYTSVMDEEIKKGGLNANYDVIILPHDSTGHDHWASGVEGRFGGPSAPFPPEYRSGIGEEGVEALKDFVNKGGTLVTLGRSHATSASRSSS